jgi:hypothetical protein
LLVPVREPDLPQRGRELVSQARLQRRRGDLGDIAVRADLQHRDALAGRLDALDDDPHVVLRGADPAEIDQLVLHAAVGIDVLLALRRDTDCGNRCHVSS